ncbi:MAG: hypothetical protein F3741_12570 [Nitrospinae bacterium]|nr:hypothetical protein [Nitrospinota bacterium]
MNQNKNKIRIVIVIIFLILVGFPLKILAHQPRLVEIEKINVTEPEISKAYYGNLSGKPHIYTISTSSPIDLYVNILVPFIEGPEKNVTVKIFKGEQPMEILNPKTNDWKKFFEPFGQSMYWKGPEFKVRADAGNYKIHVQSTEKSMRYVLATGEIEAFDGTESLRAILLIPELKKNFFEESPFSFILSPLGWGYILLLQILVILIGFVISKILNISRVKFQMKYFQFSVKNIMICGVFFWATILFFAIQTSWHPLLIMMSGLSLFIALISRRNLS